jgi:tetraprenyl-beta-curcumene synthase
MMSNPTSPFEHAIRPTMASGARPDVLEPLSPDLMARATAALATANLRYWLTVAPVVRGELRRWRARADEIPDAYLRGLALRTLAVEGFTAEVAATLATLAPRSRRRTVIEAIVALEVMYDYLDGLTEQPAADPVRNGHRLFQAFLDAVDPDAPEGLDYHSYDSRPGDGSYLSDLAHTVRAAFVRLPRSRAVLPVVRAAAVRCAEAQIRVHTVEHRGGAQLRGWAEQQAAGSALGWREFLAGAASSVLSVHALIAFAADARTTTEQAREIDSVYLSIAVLSTMLDSVIDYERDLDTGTVAYIGHYESPALLAERLVDVVRTATRQALSAPRSAHHVMTLAGVVAFYGSSPSATHENALPVMSQLQRQLRPLITPTLMVLRTWRWAKRVWGGT